MSAKIDEITIRRAFNGWMVTVRIDATAERVAEERTLVFQELGMAVKTRDYQEVKSETMVGFIGAALEAQSEHK